jgi:hypothetical protein
MVYTNFDTTFTYKHGVIVKNWPLTKFVNPSNVSTRGELETLQRAWENGQTYFEKMSETEWAAWRKRWEEKSSSESSVDTAGMSTSVNLGISPSIQDPVQSFPTISGPGPSPDDYDAIFGGPADLSNEDIARVRDFLGEISNDLSHNTSHPLLQSGMGANGFTTPSLTVGTPQSQSSAPSAMGPLQPTSVNFFNMTAVTASNGNVITVASKQRKPRKDKGVPRKPRGKKGAPASSS